MLENKFSHEALTIKIAKCTIRNMQKRGVSFQFFIQSLLMMATVISFVAVSSLHSHQESGLEVDQTHACLVCKIQNGFSTHGIFNSPTEFFQNLPALSIVSNYQLPKCSSVLVLNFSRAPPR